MNPPLNEVLTPRQRLERVTEAMGTPNTEVNIQDVTELTKMMPDLIAQADTHQTLRRLLTHLDTRRQLATAVNTATLTAASAMNPITGVLAESNLAVVSKEQRDALESLRTSLNNLPAAPMVESPRPEPKTGFNTPSTNTEVLQNPEAMHRTMNNWVVLGLSAAGILALVAWIKNKSRSIGSAVSTTLIAGAATVVGLFGLNYARAHNWWGIPYLSTPPEAVKKTAEEQNKISEDQVTAKKALEDIVKSVPENGTIPFNDPRLTNINRPDASPDLLQLGSRSFNIGGTIVRFDRTAPNYALHIGNRRFKLETTKAGLSFNVGEIALNAQRIQFGARTFLRVRGDVSRSSVTQNPLMKTVINMYGGPVGNIYFDENDLSKMLGNISRDNRDIQPNIRIATFSDTPPRNLLGVETNTPPTENFGSVRLWREESIMTATKLP